MAKLSILYREELKEYDFGQGHPFRADRYQNFISFLKENLSENHYQIVKPEKAEDSDLSLIHSQEYIDFVDNFYSLANLGLSFPALPMVRQFLSSDNIPGLKPGKLQEGARLIAGSAKLAGELVWQGKFEKAVVIGGGMHHAKRSYGEGFCIFNDVAICAENLKRKYDLERILILDTDAHAGNGTAEIFYQDPKVLFIDLHQDPRTIYPGTGFVSEIGQGKGEGFTINIPLPILAGNDSYQLVFEEIVLPVTEEFKPQIIIRNGGSDPHFADQLTNLGLTLKGFEMIGKMVRKMAKICQGPEGIPSGSYGAGKVVDLIGSGYNQKVLPLAWLSLISGLAGFDLKFKEPFPIPKQIEKDHQIQETKRVIKEVKKRLSDYWKNLG